MGHRLCWGMELFGRSRTFKHEFHYIREINVGDQVMFPPSFNSPRSCDKVSSQFTSIRINSSALPGLLITSWMTSQ